ncbi:hypothetical protein LJC49_02185 [Ruminococcaceae bacterium OttesenSCG-928-I18]|nr:hypothetical protein [Ruminococcaceae bacterium OttesenSCG-928-I18]
MRETFHKLRHFPLILLFFGLVALYSFIDTLSPDRELSQMENRTLTQRPAFDAAAFFNNQWTREYGEYTKDQFLFRDGWITLQSFMETVQGKLENGGVWFARDDYLIAKNTLFTEVQQRTLEMNTEAVCGLAQRHEGQVRVMVVPSAANILSDELRWNPPQMDENALLDSTFEALMEAGAEVVDLRQPFASAHGQGEQIYYRTDHHWTTTGGALLAYEAFCGARGMEPILPEESLLREVPDFYGTNYARSKKFGTVPDSLFYYDFPYPLTVYRYEQDDTLTAETGPIMEAETLDTYDRYGAFLRGNNGYSVIEGTGEGSILVVKDSYGNSFVPYLAQNYARVGIIDLRAWFEVDETFQEEGYDEILVLYSFDNFTTDTNVVRMMVQ